MKDPSCTGKESVCNILAPAEVFGLCKQNAINTGATLSQLTFQARFPVESKYSFDILFLPMKY